MRSLATISASVLLLSSFCKPRFGTSDSINGYWEGVAFKDGEKLQFVVDFRTDGNGIRGTISVTDMGILGAPLTNIRYRPPNVHFETPDGSDSSMFDGQVEGEKISGTWQFLGTTGTFVLRHTVSNPPPYKEEMVRFRNGDISLEGTLILPLPPGPHPAIVFTHGSGQMNRDALRFMADFFARHEIAGLIYDKRGAGASTGDWRVASFEDLAEDALAAVRLLKRRADISPKQIGLWGLSQPGWINPLAASRSKDVGFVIGVSGACTTPEYQEMKRVEFTLRADGFSEDEIREAVELMKLKFNFARSGAGWEEYKAALEKAENKRWFDRGGRESGFLAAPTSKESWSWRFWRQINDFDPTAVWKNVQCPVLAIYGESDTITPVRESVRNLQKALKQGASKNYTIKVFPRADHGIYVWPKPGQPRQWPRFADGYLEAMAKWLLQHVSTGRSRVSQLIAPTRACYA